MNNPNLKKDLNAARQREDAAIGISNGSIVPNAAKPDAANNLDEAIKLMRQQEDSCIDSKINGRIN
jgi:hypothetical protein